MNANLTAAEAELHDKAHEVFGIYRRAEAEIIDVIQRILPTKLFRKLGYSGIYNYIVGEFHLTEAQAYAFKSVAICAQTHQPLQKAIFEKRINVARASRIVACLNDSNASEMTEFAIAHSARETDFEAARRNPKARKRDRAKPIAADMVEVFRTLSREGFEKLQRVEALEAQRGTLDRSQALENALDLYLEQRDPVRKAQRAQSRKSRSTAAGSSGTCARKITLERACAKENASARQTKLQSEFRRSEVNKIDFHAPRFKRVPLTAAQEHATFLRDGGKCTHVDINGKRCGSDRWIHIHHIVAVANGGSNKLENLATLCSFHHDLVHQLSFPIEGQINWIRAATREYVAEGISLEADLAKARAWTCV
jgi:hypothetical protein